MFRRRWFYYLLSFLLVACFYWLAQNSPLLNLVGGNKDQSICLALPKKWGPMGSTSEVRDLPDDKLKALFSTDDFALEIKTYESPTELKDLYTNLACDILVFASQHLGVFLERSRLVTLISGEIDLSKVSPDFLGLSFDRLNSFFVPLAFWTESTAGAKTQLHLLLAAPLSTGVDLQKLRLVLQRLISKEGQLLLTSREKIGTVLRDSEIEVPLKSSSLRSLNLKNLEIVKEEK